jgi:chromosome segregation ATPase
VKLQTWLIIGLTAVIIAMIFFWPKPDNSLSLEREQAYQREIAILKAEQSASLSRIDSIQVRVKERTSKDSIALKARNAEIRKWKQRASDAVASIPDEARDIYPQIDSALQAKDSVISQVEAKADTLQGSLYNLGKDFNSLLAEQEINSRIAADMQINCERRIQELQQENDQLRKKKKSFKEVLKQIRNYALAVGAGYVAAKAVDELK